MMPNELFNPTITKRIIIGVISFFVFLLLWSSFYVVDATERGLLSFLGKVNESAIISGFHLKLPFLQSINKISLLPQRIDVEIPVGASGAITKDNQTVGAFVTVFSKYDENKLVEMFTKYGESQIKNLVATSSIETLKEVIGGYTIFDVAQNQEKIRIAFQTKLNEKIKSYPIIIVDTKIQNYDWSDSFDTQIQETMSKAQQVKQAEQEKLIVEQQAGKKVKEAEAEKQSTILRAEALRDSAKINAEAKALEGEGIRRYNEEISKNWDIQLKLKTLEIEYARINKWNGVYVPNNMYGPIPFNTQGGIQGQ